jgi:hypothetical protein
MLVRFPQSAGPALVKAAQLQGLLGASGAIIVVDGSATAKAAKAATAAIPIVFALLSK